MHSTSTASLDNNKKKTKRNSAMQHDSHAPRSLRASQERGSTMKCNGLRRISFYSEPPIVYKSQSWIKKKEFKGTPNIKDFTLVSQDLPPLNDREIRLKAICWAINWYMISYHTPVGSVMIGEQLARVEESRHPDFHEHAVVVAALGWRSAAVVSPDQVFVRVIPQPPRSVPLSLFLGTTGLPGMMLYMAFMNVCRPLCGDVVLINGNLFAIELVGTLALKELCKVIVVVSSSRLKEYILNKFHFHLVMDYTRMGDPSVIFDRMFAPSGVDIYFDTVGAGFTQHITQLLRPDTRTCIIGDSAHYCTTLQQDYQPDPYRFTSFTCLRPTTHHLFDFQHLFGEAEQAIMDLIKKTELDEGSRSSYHDYVIHPKVNCPATDFKDLPSALGSLKASDICSHTVVPYLSATDASEGTVQARWLSIRNTYHTLNVKVV